MMTPTPPLILLVDDSPEIALIVQRLAKDAGHAVVSCADVPSAWNYFGQSAAPDLLILDLNLPGENGLVLCARIRATSAFERLPIALFSDWERAEDIAAGLRAGADFVLSKELLCRPEVWQKRLDELLLPADSRRAALSLNFKRARAMSLTATRCAYGLNLALQRPELTVLSADIVCVLLERAASAVAWPWPCNGLNRHAHGLSFPNLAGATAERIVKFAGAASEQIGCVLGHAASHTFALTFVTALTNGGEPLDQR
jgi:DNA-binding response OmpR family regulator